LKNSHQSGHNPGTTQAEQKGSNKSFGLVFATVFVIVGLWPLLSSEPIRLWSIVVALGLVLISLLLPDILEQPNRLWTKFGLLLHRITNPLLLGILFLFVFVPMALWLRIVRRQPISRMSGNEETFWKRPTNPVIDPESFRKLY
jgi:hypothetical protein